MKKMRRKNITLAIGAVFFFVLLWGCAAKQSGEVKQDQNIPRTSTSEKQTTTTTTGAPGQTASPQTQTSTGYYIHTVKWSGESVSIIAGWYLGDIHKWEILRDCNPDMDPNVVVIGQKIRIPESLMTTRTPMTKAHVDKFYPKAERHKRAPAEPKDEAPTLYGPK